MKPPAVMWSCLQQNALSNVSRNNDSTLLRCQHKGYTRKNDLNWYSREDSNLHDGRFELPMSAGLHHASRCWCCRKDLNLQLHGSQPCASASCATTATCLIWYRRRDSNPHCLVPKTSASSRLGYAGMVNPAGLEPATCRLGNDCSNSN